MNKDLLLSLVERIEKLNADTEAIAADIKEIYHEAKMQGFDVKAIKKCIALRKKDKDEREEEDEKKKVSEAHQNLIKEANQKFVI